MTKLEITKTVAKTIVGIGASKIAHSIIKNNVSPDGITDQVTIGAGSFVVGMIVSDVTAKYTETKIDEIAAWYNANVKKNA